MKLALAGALLGAWLQGTPRLERVADEALRACRDEAVHDLVANGRLQVPDVWPVADFVRGRGEASCASALVPLAPVAERDALEDYLHSELPRASATFEEQLEALGGPGRQPAFADGSPVQRVRLRMALGRRPASPLEAARSAFEEAAELARGLGWLSAEAEALHEAALRARRMPGGLEAATECWTRAVRLEEELDRAPRHFARALCSLGNAHGEAGRFGLAEEHLQRARDLHAAAGAVEREVEVLHSLGVLEVWRGRPNRARVYLETARELGVPRGVLQTLIPCDLAEAYGSLGDHERARELAAGALASARAGNRPLEVAFAHHALGLAFVRAGDPVRALPEFEAAASRFSSAGDLRSEAVARGNVALCLLDLDRVEAAETAQRAALATADRLSDTWLRAECRFHLGRILRRAGRLEEARECDALLLATAQRLQSSRLLMRAYLNIAERHLAEDEYAAAFEAARSAAEAAHTLLAGLAPEEDARAREYRAGIYRAGLRAAVGTGVELAVFQAIEQGRAGALLESIVARRQLTLAAASPRLEAERERAAERELAALREYQSLRTVGDTEDAAGALAVLESAREELRSVVQRIQREARAGVDLVYQQPPSIADVQARLTDGEAFVSYAWVDPEAYALVVTPTAARLVSLGGLDSLERGCLAFRASAGSTRGVPLSPGTPLVIASESSNDLRRLLLDPLELPEAVRRLYVSPDGSLAYVPLALATPEREIVYVPSATTYGVLAEHAPSASRRVLALGDPTLPPASELAPLPGARAEVAAVGDAVLVADEAHEAALKEHLRDPWRSVHLACHAVIDPQEPLDSALVLAAGERTDGRLTALEVFELSLKTDLVVLSACETAVGKVYRAEGVVGFTRAFLSAGAPRVIVSLWKVDDAATNALMTRLYELWNPDEGEPMELAAALRAAQEHVRSQPRWSAPHYWAAWQLWGLAD